MNHVTNVNYVKHNLAYEAWFLHVEYVNHDRSYQGLLGLLDNTTTTTVDTIISEETRMQFRPLFYTYIVIISFTMIDIRNGLTSYRIYLCYFECHSWSQRNYFRYIVMAPKNKSEPTWKAKLVNVVGRGLGYTDRDGVFRSVSNMNIKCVAPISLPSKSLKGI